MSTMTLAPERTGVRTLAVSEPLTGRGWALWALSSVALAPFVRPVGPGQTAIVDVINLFAFFAFAAIVLVHRVPLRFPFAMPILFISAGSLIAMVNVTSFADAALAIVQDAYLYIWFVMLVEVLRRRGGDARDLRITWVVVTDIVAVMCILQAVAFHQGFPRTLLSPKGDRTFGPLYNPNMCADFLVLGAFIMLGLRGRAPRKLMWPSFALWLVAFLSTKSNGGLVGLVSGLTAWVVIRAWQAGRLSLYRLAGMAAVGAAAVLVIWWASAGWGVGGALLNGVGQGSQLARLGHSGEERGQIWARLEASYKQSPLGIGPGNSTTQPLDVTQQEREGVFMSKEPHSDYIGYAIERGPIAFLALLVLTWMIIAHVLRGCRALELRSSSAATAAMVVAAMAAGLVGSSVHSIVIEKLHFRHFWVYLAMAVALTTKPDSEPEEEEATE
jgi:hypothetical protein